MSAIIASGIPNTTTDEKVTEFFTFCGKVNSVTVTDKTDTTKTVKVVFENASAVSTAVLLNGAELNGSVIKVSEDPSAPPAYSAPPSAPGAAVTPPATGDIRQEDKPKAAIAAEYLANGYVLSDKLIQKAIDFDGKHGVTNRFKSFLDGIESKYHIKEKKDDFYKEYKVDEKVSKGRQSLDTYLDKLKGQKYGAKVHQFYKDTSKEVKHVHEEARRIADAKVAANATAPAGAPPSATGATVDPTINTISANSTTAQAAGVVPLEKE